MVPRSLKHTIQALETFEIRELWVNYGLVGDIVVRTKYIWHLNISPYISQALC